MKIEPSEHCDRCGDTRKLKTVTLPSGMYRKGDIVSAKREFEIDCPFCCGCEDLETEETLP